MFDYSSNSINQPPVESGYLCKECYRQIPENANFCPYCGKRVINPLFFKCNDPEKWKTYFRNILQKDFSEYSIKEDVPVTELVGDTYDVFRLYKDRPNQVYKAEWGRAYDFVLYLDGKIKGVISLGFDHSHQSNVKYMISRMFAKKLKVPYVGFYTIFPNEEEYVCRRIKEFIE